MDYKLIVIFGDGYVREIGCATFTDVENHILSEYRSPQACRQKIVTFQVVNHAYTD